MVRAALFAVMLAAGAHRALADARTDELYRASQAGELDKVEALLKDGVSAETAEGICVPPAHCPLDSLPNQPNSRLPVIRDGTANWGNPTTKMLTPPRTAADRIARSTKKYGCDRF